MEVSHRAEVSHVAPVSHVVMVSQRAAVKNINRCHSSHRKSEKVLLNLYAPRTPPFNTIHAFRPLDKCTRLNEPITGTRFMFNPGGFVVYRRIA